MGEGRELPPDSVNRPGDEAFSPPLKDPGQGTGDPLVALREGDPPLRGLRDLGDRPLPGFLRRKPRGARPTIWSRRPSSLFRLASQHAAGADYAAQGRFESLCVPRGPERVDRPQSPAVSAAGHSAQDATELAISTDARREAAAPTTPDAHLETEEESARVREAVRALPETHRIVSNWGSFRSCRTARSPTLWRFPWGP